jgi:methylmalonyl-CoA epimerase
MAFEIVRVDHVSLAAWKAADRLRLYRDVLGFVPEATWVNEEDGFTNYLYRLPGVEPGIEFIEPVAEEAMVGRFLRSRGEGVHHISLIVKDVHAAAAALEAAGIRAAGMQETEYGPRFYIHPRDSGGVLFHVSGEE